MTSLLAYLIGQTPPPPIPFGHFLANALLPPKNYIIYGQLLTLVYRGQMLAMLILVFPMAYRVPLFGMDVDTIQRY